MSCRLQIGAELGWRHGYRHRLCRRPHSVGSCLADLALARVGDVVRLRMRRNRVIAISGCAWKTHQLLRCS